MAETSAPAHGKLTPRQWYIIAGVGAAYVGYRWYKAKSTGTTSTTSTASTPGTLAGTDANGNPVYLNSSGQYVDANGNPDVVAQMGASSLGESYVNPNPTAGSTLNSPTGGPSTDEQWTADVVQDLENQGYDGPTVSTAIALYLSSQPLTPDQVTIIRTAWAYEGRPPGEPNLPIIQASSTTTTSGGGSTGTSGGTTGVGGVTALTPGQVVQVPTQFTPGQPTWAAIAKKAGISVQHLQENNPTVTQANGAVLNVPVLVTGTATWQSIASQWGISAAHLQLNNPTIDHQPATAVTSTS